MTAAILPFPVDQTRPSDWREPGTHEVFVWVTRKRLRDGGYRDSFAVDESRADGDWWGRISEAASFDQAIRIALAHVEPSGVVLLIFDEEGDAA